MINWNTIQGNNNPFIGQFITGSTQAISNSQVPLRNYNTALQRKGIYSPEVQQTSWQDNRGLQSAIAQKTALERELLARQPEVSVLPESSSQAYLDANSVTTISAGNGKFSTNQKAFYDSLVQGGLSNNQALAVMANVQAENSFMDKYLFGSHQDGKKRAYGALSWQGGREIPLLAKLKAEGLIKDGQIINNPRVMQLQAQHFLNELAGTEKGNSSWFRANRNADVLTLARDLNKRVIRSNQSAKVLAGRERSYNQFLKSTRG